MIQCKACEASGRTLVHICPECNGIGWKNEGEVVGVPQSFDAAIWASEFMKLFGEKREDIDEALMISWFANALMRGYDEARR